MKLFGWLFSRQTNNEPPNSERPPMEDPALNCSRHEPDPDLIEARDRTAKIERDAAQRLAFLRLERGVMSDGRNQGD